MSNPDDDAKTLISSPVAVYGKLIFPDESFYEIDNAMRFVGRADLKKYTDHSPNDISRFEFTIYKKGENFFMKRKKEEELQLENSQIIEISDVKMKFEV